MTRRLIAIFIAAALPGIACAQTEATAEPDRPEELDERASYAIGLNLGRNFADLGVELDGELVLKGLEDGLAGESMFSDQELAETMGEFQQVVQKAQQEKLAEIGAENAAEGEVFLAENKEREGVVTTASGLQYEILEAGDGAKPLASDRVTVHYRGTLVDGTEFDSSIKRGQPATFPLAGVIPGWTEALQLMPVGSKWKIYLPANLAYGERGSPPSIGPNSTLVFEVELIDIAAQTQPAAELAPADAEGGAEEEGEDGGAAEEER